jgi:hypothetical protein
LNIFHCHRFLSFYFHLIYFHCYYQVSSAFVFYTAEFTCTQFTWSGDYQAIMTPSPSHLYVVLSGQLDRDIKVVSIHASQEDAMTAAKEAYGKLTEGIDISEDDKITHPILENALYIEAGDADGIYAAFVQRAPYIQETDGAAKREWVYINCQTASWQPLAASEPAPKASKSSKPSSSKSNVSAKVTKHDRSTAPKPSGAADSLAGYTICVTGAIEGFTRTDIQKVIHNHGGATANGITKAVNLVVLGQDAGPKKLEAIEERKLETVDYDGLLRMIKSSNSSKRPVAADDVDDAEGAADEEPKKKATKRGKKSAT